MSTRNSLSVLITIGLLTTVGCSTSSTTISAGKATVTTTTNPSTIYYPVARPNPTPYSGIPAFVGQNINQ